MDIMCVCLFSTLSRRVGALHISIIIIIILTWIQCTRNVLHKVIMLKIFLDLVQGPSKRNMDSRWEITDALPASTLTSC